jgi:adenylate kinase family enzyme
MVQTPDDHITQPRTTGNPPVPRIVIVGPCASGKSTLAENLGSQGVDARISGQEHSEIKTLWQRQNPDILVGLTLDLATLRQRRGQSWSQSLFDTQQRRLQHAFASAHLLLDTARLSEQEVTERVMQFIASVSESQDHPL